MTRPQKPSHLPAACLAGMLAWSGIASADVLIDDFSQGSPWSFSGSGAFTQHVGNVLGGVREVGYDFASPLPGNTLALSSSVGLLFSGTFNMPGIDNTQKTFSLTYDADDTPGAGLGYDLSQADAIVVRAMADSWAQPGYASTLALSLTDSAAVTRTLHLSPGAAPFAWNNFAFALSDPLLVGLDLGHVDRISLGFTSALSGDTTFDRIGIVGIAQPASALPVPEADTSAYMLIGMGLLGLIARRRR